VLVIVEDRDVTAGLELFFDLKAARCRYVFHVDAAETAGQQADRVDDLVDIFGSDAKRKGVDTAKRLEQDTLAFHDRHAGLGPDVAQSEHSRSVGHDRDHIPAAGVDIRQVDILLDFQARLRDARRIGD